MQPQNVENIWYYGLLSIPLHRIKQKGTLADRLGNGLQNRVGQFDSARYLNKTGKFNKELSRFTFMLIPFGGLLEWKRGSKYIFFVFITSMVISSIVFHVLTQDRDIQASGISAVGYAFVTGGVLNMFDIWKNLSVLNNVS